MAGGRIYVVENDDSASLVRAVSPARALSYVVKEQYKVKIASADDVANLMSLGATIEDATAEPNDASDPADASAEG